MNYRQLWYQDRVTIEIQLKRGATQKEIAHILSKNPATISREIRRNSVQKKWETKKLYLASEANMKAYQKCWRSKTQSMKINMNSEMKRFIISELESENIYLSPKVIANTWNQNNTVKISHTSIYKWLNTGAGNKYKVHLAHSYKGYKKSTWEKKSKIIGRIGIEERSDENTNRQEIGHFEADLIVSKKGYKWALLTLVDRKTRLPRIFKLKDKSSEYIMKCINDVHEDIGIKSITFDNGMEFAKHYLLHQNGIKTYFSDPYSPWQKWSIENLNRMVRRAFPKWTIFDHVSEEKIKSICLFIANTLRNILGFLSPNQAHFQTT